jgi:hypothetical protein
LRRRHGSAEPLERALEASGWRVDFFALAKGLPDNERDALRNDAYEGANRLFLAHKATVEAVAARLIQCGQIDASEFVSLMRAVDEAGIKYLPQAAEQTMADIEGKNRIMIFGPKADGTYVVEFRTAKGQVLAISIPSGETAVLKYFQQRMPYGLFVPDVETEKS